ESIYDGSAREEDAAVREEGLAGAEDVVAGPCDGGDRTSERIPGADIAVAGPEDHLSRRQQDEVDGDAWPRHGGTPLPGRCGVGCLGRGRRQSPRPGEEGDEERERPVEPPTAAPNPIH